VKKFLVLNPAFPEACTDAGILTIHSDGHYEEALSYFERAISADPGYSEAYYRAGMCCIPLKKYEAMRFYLGRYLRLKPDAAESAEIRMLIEKKW